MNNFKKEIEYINHRIDYLNNYIAMLTREKIVCDINIQKERVELYKSIKCALEMLDLLIKWKDFIDFDECYEYLLNDEIKLFDSDIKLLNTYLRHHKNSYVPISFRHLKKESEK